MKKKCFKSIIVPITAAAASLTLTIPVIAAAYHIYDVNRDGNVTLADYAYSTMVLSGYKPNDYNKFDVNANGVISIADSSEIFDYTWYGARDSIASVASFDNLIPENTNIASVYQGITYLKRNCSTGATSEYTLTTTGETTASTASVEQPTSMIPDPNETAVVKLTKPDGNPIGTGTIIDNHIIATAAHCVYDHISDDFRNINVKIVNSSYTEIASYSPSYIHIPKEYTINETYVHDYALIYVEQDLSQYGKFEVGMALDSFVADTTGTNEVSVSGFPRGDGIRYYATGDINGELNLATGEPNQNIIHYFTETAPGDSGGPLYIEEEYSINGQEYNCKTMIGIHVAGGSDDYHYYGRSRRITSDQLYFYRSNTNLN